jgi:hypothetical protein
MQPSSPNIVQKDYDVPPSWCESAAKRIQFEVAIVPATSENRTAFKRNQIEEAIALVLEPGTGGLSTELRTRIKWLLDTDRILGRDKHSTNPQRSGFAFYSRETPGRGGENWFSEYEAFAVLTALRLIRHGSPLFAVPVLRGARPELEQQHARILAQDPRVLFERPQIRQRVRPGDIAVDNTDPTFLAVAWSKQEAHLDPSDLALCRGQAELIAFFRSHGIGRSIATYEIVNSVHDFHAALATTRPRKRGVAAK